MRRICDWTVGDASDVASRRVGTCRMAEAMAMAMESNRVPPNRRLRRKEKKWRGKKWKLYCLKKRNSTHGRYIIFTYKEKLKTILKKVTRSPELWRRRMDADATTAIGRGWRRGSPRRKSLSRFPFDFHRLRGQIASEKYISFSKISVDCTSRVRVVTYDRIQRM